jgi:calpain-15
VPFEVMKHAETIAWMRENGIKNFVDPHFPPRDSSVYDVVNDDYPYETIVHWRRPKEFMRGRPQVFDSDIDPNDIKQGFLPDCWFLSAASCLAERQALVKRLFNTKEYNEEGLYKLRLVKNGEWVVVTVDDYIPCYYNAGPMFSRAKGNELWALLLEKAYAKLHGHYYALRYGFTHHGMMDLSGCPTTLIEWKDWDEERKDELFDEIEEFDNEGYLMSAETSGFDDATEGGGPDAAGGLVSGHAYSVI